MKKKMNNSAAKKLVPAAGMLGVSAMMLATSTYAWFTMNKEVELTGIQMTASVPADLQISVGKLSTAAGSGNGLVNNQGILVPATGASADNGGVAAPGDVAEYWSNTANISAYYALGRIMPASSQDGLNIYYTPDAAGVGKSIKAGAKYYSAVQGAADTGDNGTSNDKSYATLHAYTAKSGATISDNWATSNSGYTKAVTWNDTNDDGYYVDIPVWLRSSRKEGVSLSVDAYVTTNSYNDADELYLAARAVILNSTRTTSSGLIEIRQDSWSGNDSIVDFMSSTNPLGAAVKELSTGEGSAAVYNGDATYYTGTNDVVTLTAAGPNERYGTPTQVWVRVWLEGEDANCWNDNAGQDFNISLKFSEDAVNITGMTKHHFTADSTLLVSGATTTATVNGTALTYTFNGTEWRLSSGRFEAAPVGREYKIGDTVIADQAALAAYLNAHVATQTAATTGVTVTAGEVTGRTQVVATRTGEGWSYSASIPSSSVDHITVNGVNYADQAAMEEAITVAGSYTVYIVYTT